MMEFIDRLLTTREAGEMLGGMCPKDVLRLIDQGKLKAKLRPLNGVSPRSHRFVKQSEVLRYMDNLPDAPANALELKPRRERLNTGLRKELATVTQYY